MFEINSSIDTWDLVGGDGIFVFGNVWWYGVRQVESCDIILIVFWSW